MEPFLTFAARRDLREKAFRLFTLRGDGGAHDNTPLITEIMHLRAQKAKLLGYPNYAAYVLYDQMANTPDKVLDFMNQLVGPLAEKSAAEAKEIQDAINASGEHFDVKPWDWERYSDQVRRERQA